MASGLTKNLVPRALPAWMEATAGTARATRSSSESSLSWTDSLGSGDDGAASGGGRTAAGAGGREGCAIGVVVAAARGSEALLRHQAGRAMAAPSTRPTARSTIPFRADESRVAGTVGESWPTARDAPQRHDATRDGTRRPHVEQSQCEESEGGIAR